MHFQYFFPNKRSIKLEQLLEAGLGYVFEPETSARTKTPFTPISVTNGPDGQHGLIVSLSDEHIGYYKDKQVWKQEFGADYWVGMWTDPAKRPTPESLARENQIKGQWLRLADGHDWLFPMATYWEHDNQGDITPVRTLPGRMIRNEFGRWTIGSVTERYRKLWNYACEFWGSYVSGAVDDTDIDDAVVECFKTNYRVNAAEIELLEVYEPHLREQAMWVLLDLDNYSTLIKKKLTTLATGDLYDGQPVQTEEPTAQPSAT